MFNLSKRFIKKVYSRRTWENPHDVKENVTYETSPPSSIALWSSCDAHAPTVVAFGIRAL